MPEEQLVEKVPSLKAFPSASGCGHGASPLMMHFTIDFLSDNIVVLNEISCNFPAPLEDAMTRKEKLAGSAG
jgi:hypothetical protein